MTEVTFEHYDATDERRREALFTLCNGVISLRGSAPETAIDDAPQPGYPGLYWAGLYDNAERWVNGERCAVEALVNLPDPLGLSLSADRLEWLDNRYEGYHQAYNMANAQLHRRLAVTCAGTRLQVTEARLVSHADPTLIVLRWEITSPAPPPGLWLRSTLRVRPNALIERNLVYEGQRLAVDSWYCEQGHSAVRACLSSGRAVAVGCHTSANVPVEWEGDAQQRDTWLQWPAQGPLVVEKHIRVAMGDTQLPTLCRQLPAGTFDDVQAAHRSAWGTVWQKARIQLENAHLQQSLDFGLAHILQTITPLSVGRDLGFPARAWQEGYHGQVFWDELFVFPFLASRFPERAQNLLAYRYRRLGVARQRARAAGFQGALYPWRSGESGHEQTPPWMYYPLSGHWVQDPTWRQRHIGAAIAYDAWLLYLATGDRALLAGMAGEIIIEVARCWASMARLDPARDRYVIQGVIGPDEYHNRYPGAAEAGLDNNTYTNLMAAWTLQRAQQVLAQLPAEDDMGLRERLGLGTEEPAQWDELSRRLYLPALPDGVLSQFEGFDRLLMPPRTWFEQEHPRLDWMLEAQGDSTDRYQVTKQADTLMLLHLFPPQQIRELIARLGYPIPEDNGRHAVEHHLSRISHESSLSHTVCAGAMAHVDLARSWTFFCKTLSTDLASSAHSGTQEGVHLAAMAGALDVLQRHYLGLRPELDGLHVFPDPPPELGPAALRLCYRGQWLNVAWAEGQLRLQLANDATGPITLVHHQGRTRLGPGEEWAGILP